ncbi:MAG: hypothetical protein H6810_07590 [Phycisphaeraceae bacterium]|nr:MAG: hypothetical protein H6810_07590 [Phycisphaeraceae bacterium]
MRYASLTAAVVAGLACGASAQSASVTVSSSGANVAPGGTVTITVASNYDTAGAGGGLFGAAGFYGFGGNVTVSGDAAVTATVPAINANLTFGAVTTNAASPDLVRAAAGRGFDGGLAANPATMMTFDVTADAGATAGQTFTLDFAGAVVLVLNSNLTTYSTSPGLNQAMLTTNSVTVTVGAAGCNPADIAEPYGLLDLGDITGFISAFTTQNPLGDIDNNGLFDLTDINLFVTNFLAGCP